MLSGPARATRGPEMADRLVQAIRRDAEDSNDHGVDELLRLLREQPAGLLRERADAIQRAARSYLSGWPSSAAPLVEVLQLAGRYDLAVELGEELIAAVPDTTEQAIVGSQR